MRKTNESGEAPEELAGWTSQLVGGSAPLQRRTILLPRMVSAPSSIAELAESQPTLTEEGRISCTIRMTQQLEKSLCTPGGRRVPALAFGTSGIAPELTQRSVFSALQVFSPLHFHFSSDFGAQSTTFRFCTHVVRVTMNLESMVGRERLCN